MGEWAVYPHRPRLDGRDTTQLSLSVFLSADLFFVAGELTD